jgi:hypothetical protein
MTRLRCHRHGFTLIEVIAAMLAATVLIIGMAAAIVISTNLLATAPTDADTWRDRETADWLASDLRFATSVSDAGYGFQITKPSPAGSLETANYESHMTGLTRRVGSGPVMQLDSSSASHQFLVDGYSAPTAASEKIVRVRSTSSALTSAASSSLNISVPAGSKTGDLLLLCISAKTPNYMSITPAGWQTIHSLNIDNLRLLVAYRYYDESWITGSISAVPDAAMAASILAIENAHPYSPLSWSGSRSGFAWSFLPLTHPTAHEATGFSNGQLNLQIYASDSDPWNDGTLGMAGFTNETQVTAAAGNLLIHNTLGIVSRTGPTPTLTTTPRLLHQASTYWLQSSIRLEPAP